jgi:hypothetical protein
VPTALAASVSFVFDMEPRKEALDAKDFPALVAARAKDFSAVMEAAAPGGRRRLQAVAAALAAALAADSLPADLGIGTVMPAEWVADERWLNRAMSGAAAGGVKGGPVRGGKKGGKGGAKLRGVTWASGRGKGWYVHIWCAGTTVSKYGFGMDKPAKEAAGRVAAIVFEVIDAAVAAQKAPHEVLAAARAACEKAAPLEKAKAAAERAAAAPPT